MEEVVEISSGGSDSEGGSDSGTFLFVTTSNPTDEEIIAATRTFQPLDLFRIGLSFICYSISLADEAKARIRALPSFGAAEIGRRANGGDAAAMAEMDALPLPLRAVARAGCLGAARTVDGEAYLNRSPLYLSTSEDDHMATKINNFSYRAPPVGDSTRAAYFERAFEEIFDEN